MLDRSISLPLALAGGLDECSRRRTAAEALKVPSASYL